MKMMMDYHPVRAWPDPVVLDQDNRDWDAAVRELDRDLGIKVQVCNCSCGERGCTSSKGA